MSEEREPGFRHRVAVAVNPASELSQSVAVPLGGGTLIAGSVQDGLRPNHCSVDPVCDRQQIPAGLSHGCSLIG